jgi:hypothetical protein
VLEQCVAPKKGNNDDEIMAIPDEVGVDSL